MGGRYVVLGNGRAVGLGAYVKAWRTVSSAAPERTYGYGLTGWWPATAEEIVRQFRDGIHDRINQHIPGYGIGRKWGSDWQREVGHAAQRLNAPRRVVRPGEVPGWLRERVAHRLTVEFS